MDEEPSESFPTGVGVRQECVMLPWLFNIFMDECMREMKAVEFRCMTEDECNGLRMIDEYYSVYMRRKLKLNAGKNRLMVFE